MTAKAAVASLYGFWNGKVTVVEPFRNNAFFRTSLAPLSYAWAFANGGGQPEGIYNIGSVGSLITSVVVPKTDHIFSAAADSPVNF